MADAYYAVAAPSAHAAPGAFAAPLVDLAPPRTPSRAGRVTALCIGVGALSQALYWLLTRDVSVEPEAAVRYAFVTTLGVYAIVAVVLMRSVREPLDWRPSALRVLVGLSLGGGVAYALLRGDLTTGGDPRIALMVSEGSFAHIAATVLIAVVAAPVCEEVLFRGLLLRSIAGDSRRAAVWVSAGAFAAWHLNPGAMVYYTLFGAVFAALYLRGGLSCSIAAHAAFNGTLVLAAVGYATGPGITTTGDGLALAAPPGWHAVAPLHLSGPSGAEVVVEVLPLSGRLDAYQIVDRIDSGALDALGVRPETATVVRLPIGDAVRVRVRYAGRDGEIVLVGAGPRTYGVELLSGGSPRVRADFGKMLRDLRLAS